MIGATDVIKAILGGDLTDNSTAADVFAADQLLDPEEQQFDTVDDVPPWSYMSLGTLFGASTTEALERRIVATLGMSKQVASGDIEISMKSSDAAERVRGNNQDDPGGMIGRARIMVRRPRDGSSQFPVDDDEFVYVVGMRIKRLIDQNYRSQVLGIDGDLTVPKGHGINTTYTFICYYEGYAGDENAIQMTYIYRVEYAELLL